MNSKELLPMSWVLSAFGNIPGAIIDAANQTVDIFGKKINVGKTLAGAALNKLVGGPATLAIQLAEKILPDDNIAPSTNLARSTGLLQGDTTVTQDKYGINTQTSFDPVESTKNYNEYKNKKQNFVFINFYSNTFFIKIF